MISICPEALIYARRDTPPTTMIFFSAQPRHQQPLISSPTGSKSLLVNGVHAASGSFCWDCGLVRSVPQRGSGGCPVRWRTSCRVMIMVVAHSSMAS